MVNKLISSLNKEVKALSRSNIRKIRLMTPTNFSNLLLSLLVIFSIFGITRIQKTLKDASAIRIFPVPSKISKTTKTITDNANKTLCKLNHIYLDILFILKTSKESK